MKIGKIPYNAEDYLLSISGIAFAAPWLSQRPGKNSMSNDVTFSPLSLIADLAAMRADAKSGRARESATLETEDAAPRFGEALAAQRQDDTTHTDPAADRNRRRTRGDRLMPGELFSRRTQPSRRPDGREDIPAESVAEHKARGAAPEKPTRATEAPSPKPDEDRHAADETETASKTGDNAGEAIPAQSAATEPAAETPQTETAEAAADPEMPVIAAAIADIGIGGVAVPVAPAVTQVTEGQTTAGGVAEGEAASATIAAGSAAKSVSSVAATEAGTEAIAATVESSTTLAADGAGETEPTATGETGADADIPAEGLPKAGRSPIADLAHEARAARGEAEDSGISKTVSEATREAAGREAGKPAQGLHPQRATFAEILDQFSVSNAIHRPVDILAGLDRAQPAQTSGRMSETTRPTPLQMLPIEIGMQAVRGVTNFQIRLDPAELGRVDVHLQIKESGEVNANLVVDRVETLAMLRRDASTLQYAFEQAGLKQSADGLTFSLRGEGQNGQQQDRQQGQGAAPGDAQLQAQAGEIVMRRVMIPNSSIDRMI